MPTTTKRASPSMLERTVGSIHDPINCSNQVRPVRAANIDILLTHKSNRSYLFYYLPCAFMYIVKYCLPANKLKCIDCIQLITLRCHGLKPAVNCDPEDKASILHQCDVRICMRVPLAQTQRHAGSQTSVPTPLKPVRYASACMCPLRRPNGTLAFKLPF